nr:plasmid recombination protein [Lachnospiraceae bacterium]
MKQRNFTYAEAESAYYEEERISTGSVSEYSSAKQGNALIDPSKTHLNVDLIPHHPALNPADFNKHHRGRGIAEYHKQVTGRSARMNGSNAQKSKAVGCIITLPREYLQINYGLTDREYIAVERYVESGCRKKPKSKDFNSAMEKISHYSLNESERQLIIKFLMSALRQWQKNAGIRDEDMLFAKIHFDETFPHLHAMGLPTVEKEVLNPETGKLEKKITFSTGKYNNHTTHYFDHLHENIIRGMMIEDGIDGSGLLNGATKGKGCTAADFNHEQREAYAETAYMNIALKNRRNDLQNEVDALVQEKTDLVAEVKTLKHTVSEQHKTLYKLRSAIKEAAAELKDIRSTIGDLINNGIRAIKRAFLKGNKKKAGELMDTATESLLTIQSN